MAGNYNAFRKPQATTWCLAVALCAALLVVSPFLMDKSIGQGRFALVVIGAIVGICSLVLIPYFRNREHVAEELLDDSQLLAHWSFTEEEWTAWMNLDERVARKAKWMLFGWVLFFCLFIGALFIWGDPQAGPALLGVLLALCAIIAVIIPWTLQNRRSGRMKAPREVRICRDGLRLGNELHVWHGFKARLEDIGLEEGPPCLLGIVYSTISRKQRRFHELRIPVPAEQHEEALKAANVLFDLRSPKQGS